LESVVARGVKVTYLSHGQGPQNVVLMHGNPSNPWVYRRLLEAAPPDRYRIAVIDWYGDSEPPWGGYNVSGYADQTRDVMDALDMPTAIVGGHSLGGVTAQLFAQRYQDGLDKLILIGTGPTARGHGTIGAMLERLRSRTDDRTALEGLIGGSYGTPPPPEVLRGYVDHALKVPMDAYIDAMQSALVYDFVPLLGFITVPTLILHGQHDPGRTLEHARLMNEGIPKSKLVVCDCGHYIMEEQPACFNEAVLAFLAE
jgi:pimeloyl-ACP methyl ester carboxylesterase